MALHPDAPSAPPAAKRQRAAAPGQAGGGSLQRGRRRRLAQRRAAAPPLTPGREMAEVVGPLEIASFVGGKRTLQHQLCGIFLRAAGSVSAPLLVTGAFAAKTPVVARGGALSYLLACYLPVCLSISLPLFTTPVCSSPYACSSPYVYTMRSISLCFIRAC